MTRLQTAEARHDIWTRNRTKIFSVLGESVWALALIQTTAPAVSTYSRPLVSV